MGGGSTVIAYSNTGIVDGILDAFFAFAEIEWDALSTSTQASLLDPLTSNILTGFFENTGDGGSGGDGSGGGSGSGGGASVVPLPAGLILLLTGLGGFGLARRKKAT